MALSELGRLHQRSTNCTAQHYVRDRELLNAMIEEIAALPATQRAVIYLRDVRGVATEEVCDVLAISDGAQRLHLHRARNRVRAAIARYLAIDRAST